MDSIESVLRNDNCSGCGACSLVSSRVSMRLDGSGFMRPTVSSAIGDADVDRREAELFHAVCPGVSVRAPKSDSQGSVSPTFGEYVSAWEGWATDPATRKAGSSAGILTALAAWIVESGRSSSVVGSASSPNMPSRTIPVRITTREEALESAGSRYAPVANLAAYALDASTNALIGKPCEISAAVQLHDALELPPSSRPIMLSFFCAGTPSQWATDRLAAGLGIPADEAKALRYRGNGWPGEFAVTSRSGAVATLSYDDSWGQHLGRELQWRCKICVDGTGGHADIAVGDFWKADARGYPTFDDADGISAIIVRTKRGGQLLNDAVEAGVIFARPLDLDIVEMVQPLQRDRKRTLAGRLVGRAMAAKRVPKYVGYRLFSLAAKHWWANLRAILGTFRRSLMERP